MCLPVVLVLLLQRGLPSKVMLVSAVRVRCLFLAAFDGAQEKSGAVAVVHSLVCGAVVTLGVLWQPKPRSAVHPLIGDRAVQSERGGSRYVL